MNYSSLFLLLLYLLLLIIVTYISARRETPSEFINANRDVNTFTTMAALASSFRDGAGIAAWVTLSIFFGFGALWLTIGLAAGLIVFAFFAPKIRQLASEENFLTVGDLIKLRIGGKTAWISSAIIGCTALLYAIAQIYFSGQILAQSLGVSKVIGISIPTFVVGIYVAIGGYSVVTKTDVLQWLVIMLIPTLPFFTADSSVISNISIELDTFTNVGFLNALGFSGISFLVVMSGGDVWQRLFATSSPAVARASFLLTVPVYFIISIGLVFLGLFVKTAAPSGVDASASFFEIFSSSSSQGAALLGIFVAASAMSTLDTQIFLFSSTVAKNLLSRSNEQDEFYLKSFSRLLIILTIALLGFLATTVGDIVTFLFGAVTLQTILVPLLLLSVVFTIEKQAKYLDSALAFCLVVSSILYCVMFVSGSYENIVLTLIPATFSAALCLSTYAWTKFFVSSS